MTSNVSCASSPGLHSKSTEGTREPVTAGSHLADISIKRTLFNSARLATRAMAVKSTVLSTDDHSPRAVNAGSGMLSFALSMLEPALAGSSSFLGGEVTSAQFHSRGVG